MSSFLAWNSCIKNCSNIGVIDPSVHEPDARRVNDDDGVGVVCGNIVDQVVAKLIGQVLAVKVLRSVRVDEDESSICVDIRRVRVLGIEIPAEDATVLREALLERLKGADDVWGCTASTATSSDESAVERMPVEIRFIA